MLPEAPPLELPGLEPWLKEVGSSRGKSHVRFWFLKPFAWRRVVLSKLSKCLFEQALRFFQLLVQLK